MKKKTWKRLFYDITFDIIGAILYDIGIYCFAINAKFAPVGISGISVILNHFFAYPMGITTLILNIPIILISYRIMGKKFILKSAKTMVIFAVVLDFVMPYLPQYTGNPFYAAICTGVFSGLGLTVVYLRGSSTGGTDFLIMSTRKLLPHFSIGQITWVIDGSVILIGGFVFHNIDAIILGLIAIMAATIVIDKIMYGLGSGKLVLVVTEQGNMVAKGIGDMTGRGATFLSGKGSYSQDEKQVILCACNNHQLIPIRKVVQEIDRNAFLIIVESNEVYGKGFKAITEVLN